MNQNLLYAVVLLSAAGHAFWNALLKATSDRLMMMVAIRMVGLLYGFTLLWFAGAPSIESLKWLIPAAIAMWVYQGLLVQAYHVGDLSFVYPLARGSAPMLLTAFAFFLFDESISMLQLLGVFLISLGILALALLGHGSRIALSYAILVGASIAAYSLLSVGGVRSSGNLFGCSAVLEIVSGVGVFVYAAAARGRSLASSLRAVIWPTGIGAGLLSIVGYLTFLVAAIYLPIGPVSAIRECSALFGVLVGIIVMREPFGTTRALGTLLMTFGIVVLSLL